jgi:hypothetical protein
MKWPIFLIILLASSCENLKLNIYSGAHEENAVINSKGDVVGCEEPVFNEFGCLHVDEIARLRRWMQRNCK